MKKIAVVVGLVAVMSAVALGAEWGGQNPARPGGAQKPSWRVLTADMPGMTGLLLRLDLAPEQERVLDEIAGEWVEKRNTAAAEVWKKAPKQLTGEDSKDPEKVKEWQDKYQAVMKEAAVPPPTEQIMNVLTPEQAEKVTEAKAATAAWGKSVAEILAKYNKVLDEVVGPVVATDPGAWQAVNLLLVNYKKGAPGLAGRLALTKEQVAALREASTSMYSFARTSFAFAAMAESKLSGADRAVVQEALTDWASQVREKVAVILTEDQRARIDKGLAVVEERGKAINASYDEYAAQVEKILPAPKAKAVAPGGGWVK